MPPHAGPSVSMIEEEKKVMHCVEEIRTPLGIIKEHFLMNEVRPGCDAECEDCMMNL